MKTRYREPGAEMITFGELPDSILEGVAGGTGGAGGAGVCPNKAGADGVDGVEFRPRRLNASADIRTFLISKGFDPNAVDAFLSSR